MTTNYTLVCACGKKMRVEEKHFGLTGKCVACGKPIRVDREIATPIQETPQVEKTALTAAEDPASETDPVARLCQAIGKASGIESLGNAFSPQVEEFVAGLKSKNVASIGDSLVRLTLIQGVNIDSLLAEMIVEAGVPSSRLSAHIPICQPGSRITGARVPEVLDAAIRKLEAKEDEAKAPEKSSLESESREPTYPILFNGMYQHESQRGHSSYLRFFEDGRVVSVSSTGSPEKIISWFGYEQDDRGEYRRKGNSISFESTSKNGTVKYSGSVQDNGLVLNTHSLINDHRDTGKHYKFVPVDSELETTESVHSDSNISSTDTQIRPETSSKESPVDEVDTVRIVSPFPGTRQTAGTMRQTQVRWECNGVDPDFWIGQVRIFPSGTSDKDLVFEKGHVTLTAGRVDGNQREMNVPVTAVGDHLMVGVVGYKEGEEGNNCVVALGGVPITIV